MATGLGTLMRVRARMGWNAVTALRHHSKMKIVVILLFTLALWAGLFCLFLDGFQFLGKDLLLDFRPTVIGLLFAVFFLSLLIMLMFSNGIIAYGSLFRSDETAYLLAGPIAPWNIFVYKMADALLFSSWAFLFLALPIIVAFGVSDRAPWYYYPGAGLFFATFALVPAAAGGAVTLLVGRFLSQSPRRVVVLLAVVVLAPLTAWAFGVVHAWRIGQAQSSEVWMQNVVGHLGLTRLPLLPSYWISSGIIDLAKGEIKDAWFWFQLLLANALFLGVIAIHLSRAFYITAYHRTQSSMRRRRGHATSRFYRLLEGALSGVMNAELRALIIKDVKNFIRDPVQWSQVLIFFGLLGVYFVNMRNLRYDLDSPFWQNLISLLNLVATSLTLSTFTSRFIFPLLSLEGKKFWILGLLPLERRNLLYSKFWFAFIGSFLISEGLMGVSDLMLRVPAEAMGMHAVAVLLICSGLSALAVGVGALYPNLKEDNPSKIVSGFGGTLNLVLSILFVALIVVLLAIPYHVGAMGNALSDVVVRYRLAGGLCALAIGALAVILPLWLGVRAFEKLEA